jgi:hypothetical protein
MVVTLLFIYISNTKKNVLHKIKIMDYEMDVTRSTHEEGDKWI